MPPETTPKPSAIPVAATSPAVQPDETSASASHHPLPKLRLEIRDLTHPGAKLFLSSPNAAEAITTAARSVLRLLYRSASSSAPPTRSVTLILRDMPGVAYATGTELDNDHKEIHFSLNHIAGAKAGAAQEIRGVITHELVHCLQWNAQGTCPGGLIEGIADWVRLGCDLAPPHWKKEPQDKWDAGYQHTAYLLEYLEGRFGDGFVGRLNEQLRVDKYEECKFWKALTGTTIDVLFNDYLETMKSG